MAFIWRARGGTRGRGIWPRWLWRLRSPVWRIWVPPRLGLLRLGLGLGTRPRVGMALLGLSCSLLGLRGILGLGSLSLRPVGGRRLRRLLGWRRLRRAARASARCERHEQFLQSRRRLWSVCAPGQSCESNESRSFRRAARLAQLDFSCAHAEPAECCAGGAGAAARGTSAHSSDATRPCRRNRLGRRAAAREVIPARSHPRYNLVVARLGGDHPND